MQLYEPLHGRLCRFVQSLVWNTEDARDIESETVLRAYENFERLRNAEAFLGFLFGIASRVIKKKSSRRKWWGVFDFSTERENLSDHSDGSLHKSDLKKMLSLLKADQREALTLFEVSGFSYDEIAAIQQVSLGAVKSRILRARQQLHQLAESELARMNRHSETLESILEHSHIKHS